MNYTRLVFAGIRKPEVYLYNTMLRGYSLSESPEKALFFYKQMRKIGVNTDAFASSFTLKSCANLLAVFEGKQIHCRIIQDGYEPDVFLLTSLMDMYARCHHRDDAHRVFDIMPRRDTVVWNVLISCFLQNSRTRDAMKLFEKMVTEDGAHPDNVTCLLTLQACANLGALDLGERVHEYMDQRGIGNAINLCNSLIDMYAKCGCLDKAYIVFREMMKRNVVTWTTMISGLAMHGHGRMALDAFDAMLRSGVEPDEHTLTGVLSACSHAGLVDDGHAHFHDLIHGKYKIVPNLHHYGCMVDLLGRAGMLEQAYGIISSMHAKPDATIWRTLLGACRIHGHACLGEKVMGHLVELKAQQAGDYVLLTNIYASKGNWDGVANLRKVMKDDGIQTSPGWSSIEANGEIYEFVVDDNSHPRSKEIYAMLEEMERQLKNSVSWISSCDQYRSRTYTGFVHWKLSEL
ncbi:pentatricopeptide repeat-containing protein At3g47530 [Amborella trichopoda]|uniref:pentatricopeptide repeat-containing protein At3g47530 n=1 Tax=Amborella trichopoda TaxID=13333 RepID=UPI0009C0AE58|nr:pentatricopeptide repeat-containing protein At3g47530 [Amborella trichopoda]|eukprot:XP_020520244.1 pentatricopeptide repeat-containing protein At3g47530 [Amborella trichopoda]